MGVASLSAFRDKYALVDVIWSLSSDCCPELGGVSILEVPIQVNQGHVSGPLYAFRRVCYLAVSLH